MATTGILCNSYCVLLLVKHYKTKTITTSFLTTISFTAIYIYGLNQGECDPCGYFNNLSSCTEPLQFLRFFLAAEPLNRSLNCKDPVHFHNFIPVVYTWSWLACSSAGLISLISKLSQISGLLYSLFLRFFFNYLDYSIHHLHDDVILLLRPESFTSFLSYSNLVNPSEV